MAMAMAMTVAMTVQALVNRVPPREAPSSGVLRVLQGRPTAPAEIGDVVGMSDDPPHQRVPVPIELCNSSSSTSTTTVTVSEDGVITTICDDHRCSCH